MRLLITISILFSLQMAGALAIDIPKTRPVQNGLPTKVTVSYYILDIEEIDNKNQSFTIDLIIRLKWKDERLLHETGDIRVPIQQIWNPNVYFFNLRDAETRLPEIVNISQDGTVQYTQRYYATLSSPLNFKEFPFDVQTLTVSVIAFGYTPEEVQLVFENAGSEKNYSVSDWEIQDLGAHSSVQQANMLHDQSEVIARSRLDYEFKASRHIQFYWWKILAPFMVILFLSWAVFWIDPAQVGAQIGVAGTSILTLIAFLYKLDNLLPPVSYLTHMDHFIFTSLVLVFLAYIEALVTITLAHKGKNKLAGKLDMGFRIGYPIGFLVVILFFWIK